MAALAFLLRPGGGARPAATPASRGGQVVASVPSEPRTFNPLVASDPTSELLGSLTQARLVRVNLATFETEPWLAERWDSSPDGLAITFHLRPGVAWSDGTPFTSADVLFSLRAVYDQKVRSVLAASLMAGGHPLRAAAPDPRTVVVTFAGPFGPGAALLDGLPILPKHKLEAALLAGTLGSAWDVSTPPAEIVGTGPFLPREYLPGQQVALERNPRYWRTAADGSGLPYLDRLMLRVVPEQDTELLRLQSGEIDLPSGQLGPESYVSARRAEEQGQLRLIELGVAHDADAFWFCLSTDAKRADPRLDFVQRPEFRQALSHAVDREMFAEVVFAGLAVPVWGPVTPGNSVWFSPDIPRYAPDDARARELLKGIGLEDRNGNGVVENDAGTEARFTVITERGLGRYELGTAVLRDELGRVGVALDITPVDRGEITRRLAACDYDAMYYRPVSTQLDPAENLDFWLSSGSAHFWNPLQRTPATEWERRVDTLMIEQAAAIDPGRRQQQFKLVQRILAENLPALFFAAPRMYYAHSARVRGVVPSVLQPPVLWNADSLSVAN